jgi:alkyl sulfatase BDS1-like metallo-beta-lactamase superfamily hydrolase
MMNPTQKFGQFHDGDPDEAKFFWSGGPIEVAPRTWFASQFSGLTAFETDAGVVLVDSGTAQLGNSLRQKIRQCTAARLHTVIYTHGHVDHAFGLRSWLDEAEQRGDAPPRVIAHEAVLQRFERYRRTSGYNSAINQRQFGLPIDFAQLVYRPPDTTFDDALRIDVGGLTFDIRHARGETDDHAWVYCAERRVLCSGDLFIYAAPNAGNPQKVQRYPWDWADALAAMAALDPAPEALCPGHGGPMCGAARIHSALTATCAYLRSLVEQTLALLNRGVPYDEIVLAVQPPAELAARPYLQPVYDHPEFIVRNVLRYFGGWWDQNPAMLMPASYDEQAREIVALAGGPAKLVARARALAAAGNLRLASHLADWAARGAPADAAARQVKADVFAARADEQESLMAENIFRAAARDAQP